jgi:hypothetical protein
MDDNAVYRPQPANGSIGKHCATNAVQEIAVRKGTRIWIVASLVVVLLIPIPYLASPMWEVSVVDESGAPVEGVTVRRVYKNYSTEAAGHEDDQTTDKRGHAAFTAKWNSATIARRCVFTFLSALAGVHASFGPFASVSAFGRGMEGNDVGPSRDILVFWQGQPNRMDSRIVMKRVSFP